MQKNTLGKTGLKVSCIGFGCIPIMDYPEKHSIRLIQMAIDEGINYFDTARCYKDTESKLGKAVKGCRDSVIIATKTHFRSYSEAKKSINESLRQLQVDTIDILQLHGVDNRENLNKVLGKNGAYRAVQEAQKAGKIRYIGISAHNPNILVEAIKHAHFDMVLTKFSLTNEEAKRELFPLAKKLGIGIAIMKSLDGGLLAIPNEVARLFIHGESVGIAQGAVMFAVSSGVGATVIVGIGTSKELKEIVSIAYRKKIISSKNVKKITTLANKVGKGFCLQCGYCKSHCPEEIDIPFVFKAQIYKEKFGMVRCTMWTPESIKKLVEKCVECGECLSWCPNKINIPQLLKKCI